MDSKHRTTRPASEDALRWWLDLAPTLRWTWARTYAKTTPHWYVVHGKTPGLAMADYLRVGRVIRTFGEPGKFWRTTNLYLYTEDRTRRFWCMWSDPPRPEDARLVNLATTETVYGDQTLTESDEARIARLRLPRGGAR